MTQVSEAQVTYLENYWLQGALTEQIRCVVNFNEDRRLKALNTDIGVFLLDLQRLESFDNQRITR